jgi:hypothetical protein
MKERPILFSGPMVRAILDGRKTMTRRMVAWPVKRWMFCDDYNGSEIDQWRLQADGWQGWGYVTAHNGVLAPCHPPIICPYGKPGDRLWVREKFTVCPSVNDDFDIIYDADDALTNWRDNAHKMAYPIRDKTYPSIHMPRWASRLTLEVVAVRVERVQEVTEADAWAEGVDREDQGCEFPTGRDGFQGLWDSINSARGYEWASNPWVWVVEFRKVEGAK